MSTKQEEKHHYRAVYKSDHLGVSDLEDYIEQGIKTVFTIKEVKQEFGKSVAGKKGDFNIAYFTDPAVKPWVLNATNAKVIKTFAGGNPFVETWKNIPVELYIDYAVKMKGETVGGVKVAPIQPKIDAPTIPAFTSEKFEAAKTAGADIAKIKERYTITPEVEKEYLAYVAKE
jgi:hypothetical protein